jgi:hypothetical protein
MNPLTQARLKKLVSYFPPTGQFCWVDSRNGAVKIGSVAGTLNKSTGYIHIKIDGKSYQAGRLAFLYMTGAFPKNLADHKNGLTNDNRWVNLRDATRQLNSANCRTYKNNILGSKGVFRQKGGKFAARIRVDGKSIFLGNFAEIKDAEAAYLARAQLQFGEFARAA